MNENMADIEFLIRYLDGELEPGDRLKIEDRLNAEPVLEEMLENIRATRKALRHYGIRQQVVAVREKMEKQPRHVTRLPVRIMQIAAVFLIIVSTITVYQYTRLTPEGLYHDSLQPYSMGVSRSEFDSTSLHSAYVRGNYIHVTEIFPTLQSHSPQDYFLAGIAWLRLNHPKKAIDLFLTLRRQNELAHTNSFREETDYYLAMAYLADGQSEKALALFQHIRDTRGHLYQDQVTPWFLWKLRHLH